MLSSTSTTDESNIILQNTTAGEYVIDVHPYDVMFGRGSGPNDHEGNIRFRELVSQRKAEYMATNHRQTKAKIAKDIVDRVFAVGGRFLKKLEPTEASKLGYVNNEDVYQVVGDDTIMEKAKQALRQNRNREDLSPKPPSQQQRQASVTSTTNTTGGGQLESIFQPPPPLVPSMHDQKLLSFTYPSLQQQQQQTLPPQAVADRSTSFGSNLFVQPPPNRPMVTPTHPIDALYSLDPEGYATYTKTLDDPDEEHFTALQQQQQQQQQRQNYQSFNRQNFMDMAVAAGNSTRRSSLLGGRKADATAMTLLQQQQQQQQQSQQQQEKQQQWFAQQQHQQFGSAANAPYGKRESMQFDEIWRRQSIASQQGLPKEATQSMHMSDLMESFKGMSTTGDYNSSDDTIGTIDGLPAGMSMAYMSGISQMSMNMSTDSIFQPTTSSPPVNSSSSKNNSSMSSGSSSTTTTTGGSGGKRLGQKGSLGRIAGGLDSEGAVDETTIEEEVEEEEHQQQQQQQQDVVGDDPILKYAVSSATTPNSKNDPSLGEAMESSDLWNSRQLQGLMEAPMENSSTTFDVSSTTFSRGSHFTFNMSKSSNRLSITSETMANNDSSIPPHALDISAYDDPAQSPTPAAAAAVAGGGGVSANRRQLDPQPRGRT
ncbi:hypothetical protein IV203_032256 [Nitzschia inconspicua]|uniref:DUF6824 domain-containing protein n=1 Tax=Nitzschia inconspicua TaxID=303405 RepID=A0A9K3PEV3_9STRA|nr:hypothetical protein IV203_032256 [Nitzschia inconspicua]